MKSAELTIGNTYIIDKGYSNSGEVILKKILGELFCRVRNPVTNYEWETMIHRLSNINQIELEISQIICKTISTENGKSIIPPPASEFS